MKPENVTCPNCDGPMTPRTSQHGKFWGCKAYPKCKGTRNADGDARDRRSDEGAGYRPGLMSEDAAPSDRQRGNDRSRWRGPS